MYAILHIEQYGDDTVSTHKRGGESKTSLLEC